MKAKKLYKSEGNKIKIGKYYYVSENSVTKMLEDIYNMLLLGYYKDAKRIIEKKLLLQKVKKIFKSREKLK